MFDRSAHLYDLIYTKGVGADYAAGASAIAARLPPSTRSLLDVACGTGLHLEHLAVRFDCAGIDLDPGMVDVARARLPHVRIEVADMADFDLGRTFDAVTCMFSSIAYVRTEARLREAVACMARHLADGGVLLVEPWLQREVIVPGRISVTTAQDEHTTVVRMARIRIEGDLSILSFEYLVGTADGIEHLSEEHVTALFTWDQYRDAFEAAGLRTTVEREGGPMGRGLLVGTR